MVLCLDEKRAEIKKGTQFVSAFGLTVLIFQQTNNLLSPKGDKLLFRSRRLKRHMVWRKIVNGADVGVPGCVPERIGSGSAS
jgi:hypothetical protein